MPPPVPARVKLGRTMAGSPTYSSAASASSRVWAAVERGDSSPSRSMASRTFWRSSALSMTSALAPISTTPYFFSSPAASSARTETQVLGLVDDLGLGPDHLDAVFLQHPGGVQRQGGVQSRLPAHGRQQGVGTLLLDDLLDHFRRDRLDVGGVGQFRVGHDRGRVRIDQDDPVALGLERLARLHARIVELARLSDDDRTRADDQDALDVGAFGHATRGGRAGGAQG